MVDESNDEPPGDDKADSTEYEKERRIARLKADSKLVITAASAAQKAADYIRGESKDSPSGEHHAS